MNVNKNVHEQRKLNNNKLRNAQTSLQLIIYQQRRLAAELYRQPTTIEQHSNTPTPVTGG